LADSLILNRLGELLCFNRDIRLDLRQGIYLLPADPTVCPFVRHHDAVSPRDQIIARSLDGFAEPSFIPVIAERWRAFLREGEQQGTLPFVGPNGGSREVEYFAKGNVLPARNLVILR
jgi:hypothetical protein